MFHNITPEEHAKNVAAYRRRQRDKATLEALRNMEDLRDDFVSLMKNSGLQYEDFWARGGCSPKTYQKWENKKTHKPQGASLVSTARIMGLDVVVVNRNGRIVSTFK